MQQTERAAGKGEREELGEEFPLGFGQCEFCVAQTLRIPTCREV